ncbi:hypothetical protein MKW92_031593 [Papaver armeniacum]|nr:hypothetical protein MKW92_031593 [Papaver armeniacum]
MSFIHRMVEVLGAAVLPFAAMVRPESYLVWCRICRNGRVSSQYAQVLSSCVNFANEKLQQHFNQVELKFDHINGNVCNYGPPYECQLASLLRAGVMDLI